MIPFPTDELPAIPDTYFQMADLHPLDISLYENDEQFLEDARKFAAPAIVEELDSWLTAIRLHSSTAGLKELSELIDPLERRIEFLRKIS